MEPPQALYMLISQCLSTRGREDERSCIELTIRCENSKRAYRWEASALLSPS